MEKVSSEYDLVLLDTPPVLAVTDATMLSEHVGTNILVAREGITTLGEWNEAVKALHPGWYQGDRCSVQFGAPAGPGKYRYSSHAYFAQINDQLTQHLS